jgi:hypothetical protein
MKKVTVATGNTYQAKEYLKLAGFTFGGGVWMKEGEYTQVEWDAKYANPTYNGRGNAKKCEGVKFEVKTIID